MRLTLRTLLAYLDDTLEPSEIKKIGQKVAESETAQELIARIKQITRRRRITTPPLTGPNAFDPNLVADYLDNELTSEQLAELETICLESDVHLAEVASCHQILTLVLGEPALVPPTAKERMYSLVHGREAIPFRKAATAGAHGSAPTSADADADEMFLLGLPFYRRGSWLRWALPLAGVVLLAGLGVALWQSISGINHPNQVAQTPATKPDPTPVDPKPDPTPTPVKNDNPPPPSKLTDPAQTDPKQNDPKPEPTPSVANPNTSPEARKAPPSTDRVEAGSYYFDPKSLPSILVQRKSDEDGWHRLKAGTRVYTNDRLVSLPGYASEVRLNNGVRLLLRGHIREFSLDPNMDYLQESAVVLHKPKGVDADVTLERGRLYLSNHKDKDNAVVRLRFNAEVWDLTLEPGAETAIDLLRRYRSDVNYMDGEEPVATLLMILVKGKGGLAADYQQFPDVSAPPGPSLFVWDNKGRGVTAPQKMDAVPADFAKVLPGTNNKATEEMELALKQLSLAMGADKDPVVVLEEVLQKTTSTLPQHKLAIYCLGALDEVKKLIAVLGDSTPEHFPDRATAIFTLRRWLGRDAAQGPKLFDMKTMSGLLSAGQEFKTAEAEAIFVLLHDFSEEAHNKPETYELLARYLQSDKVAIAELARWHLYRSSRSFGVDIPSLGPKKFNAAISINAPERELAVSEVNNAIKDGKLPPRTIFKTPNGTGPKEKSEPKPKK